VIPSRMWRDINRYLHYTFDRKPFRPRTEIKEVSAAAKQVARMIRGSQHGAAIMIHGVMARSGTVYVGELLRLHPEVHAYPYQLWEMPLLQLEEDIRRFQRKFFDAYRCNIGKIGEWDFLPIIGESMVAYLNHPVPAGGRVLVKVPSVEYLFDFFDMFPYENLVVLLRDGRDIVHSTLLTWPQLNFFQVCIRWRRSAEVVLSFDQYLSEQDHPGYLLARFENAVDDPAGFVREVCQKIGLDEYRYPYDRISEIKVIGSSTLQDREEGLWEHLAKPKEFRPVNHWINWPVWKKIVFKLIAGQTLIRLGYSDDNDW